MKMIPLSRGKVALVDDEDFEYLNQWKWSAIRGRATWYATKRNGNGSALYMHRVILRAPSDKVVDHINRDGLDNRRSNLRIGTYSENSINSFRQKNSTGYKGVFFDKRRLVYYSQIVVRGKTMYLGRFTTPEDAARAYDEAAKKYFRDFAWLNFPQK